MQLRLVSLFIPLLTACLLPYRIPCGELDLKWLVGLCIITLILSGIFLLRCSIQFRYRWKYTYLLVICMGVFAVSMGQKIVCERQPSDDQVQKISAAGLYAFELGHNPRLSDQSLFRAKLLGYQGMRQSESSITEVYCQLRFPREHGFRIGDTVIVRMKLNVYSDSLLDGIFDYGRYLRSQRIYWTGFAGWEQILDVRAGRGTGLYDLPRIWREYLVDQMRKLYSSSADGQILIALVLGEKSFLDREVREAFQTSGTSHLLAVSGMHMGIVFGLLSLLLQPLQRLRHGKTIYYILVIVVLWLFALLTGFGPAVRRACLLLSMVLVARLLGRSVPTLHILLAVVFILLTGYPDLTFDAGFQLSAIATAGIVIFYSPLRKRVRPSNPILRFVTDLLLVSFVAQLAVAPLCIYLFHQFQALFLLSNLLLTPLITLLMIWGLLVLAIGWIAPIAGLLNWVTAKLVLAISASNSWIASCSWSFITEIPLSEIEMLWWFFLILWSATVLRFRSVRFLILSAQWVCLVRIGVDTSLYIEQSSVKDFQTLIWTRQQRRYETLRMGNTVFITSTDSTVRAIQNQDIGQYGLRHFEAGHLKIVPLPEQKGYVHSGSVLQLIPR